MSDIKNKKNIPIIFSVLALCVGLIALGISFSNNSSDDESSNGSNASTATTPGTAMKMTAAEMDKMMKIPTDKFLDLATKQGNVEDTKWMEPKVLEDGTKQFDLTASVFDWETSPGVTVKAWGYNKQVPGPNIKVNVGDKVKIVLKNELEESTVIHIHGLKGLPNAMDGVPDVTQPPVKPGESFSYDFTANEISVAMYHSHHNAQIQVPNGLAGIFEVGALPLPKDVKIAQEIPMMLNDAGTIGLTLNGKSFPGTKAVVANAGDYILVHYLNEGLMTHPMHTHGFDQTVIAEDGNVLATPYSEDTVQVAPGSRVSVLIRLDRAGAWAWHCHILNHAEGPKGMFGMVTAIVVK